MGFLKYTNSLQSDKYSTHFKWNIFLFYYRKRVCVVVNIINRGKRGSAALALKTAAAVGLLTLKQLGKMSKSKKWIRTFEVQTIDDTDGKKVSYQVFSTLYPDGMPEACTKLVTKKSFSDFKKLYQALHHIHKSLRLSGSLPPVTSRNSFFKKRLSDEANEDRRQQCLTLLECASQFPELYNSQVFLNFFATISSPTSSLEDSSSSPDAILEAGLATQKVLAQPKPMSSPDQPSKGSACKIQTDEEDEELPDYLNKAAEMIKKAAECESEERFDESVACYRQAIGTLLTSLPKDKCLQRQASVKRRIAQYISKAEILTKLASEVSASSKVPLVKGFPHLDLFGGDLRDLKRYRIEGWAGGGKVIVATDSKNDLQKVVLKVLPKTSFNTKTLKKSLLPINVKYMVTLQRYFESDDELILVLDYIVPGRLFDLIEPYLKEKSMHSTALTSFVVSPPKVIDAEDTSVTREVEEESDVEDLEVVCTLASPEEDDEEELLCLSNSGIEKIHCYDYEKRQQERFEMLDDHTNEIIKKLDDNVDTLQTPQTLLNLKLQTPSALSSALSKAPVSPVSSFHRLCDIIPTFGGHDLSTCKTLPLSLIRTWSVQLIKAVAKLHSLGIHMMDLNPNNLLLNENGELTLTYQFQWVSIDEPVNPRALDKMYCAPEALVSSTARPEADWWSVGVLIFEMLTGAPFSQMFPSGLMPHTPLCWTEQKNDNEESELKDLITQLIQTSPSMRLTAQQLKKHRFFRGINWDS